MGRPGSNLLTGSFWLALVAAVPALAQDRASTRPPDLPYFEWNACPFEGCIYRKWTAVERVRLYSSWAKSRRVVGELTKGDTVVAVTGVVITYRAGTIEFHGDAGQVVDPK